LLAQRARSPHGIVAYDNINFMDRKRDEDAGHTAVYRSFTNAMYVECKDLPTAGLTQDMHDPTVPLQLRDIVTGPGIAGVDDIGPQATRSLIADAIKRLHPCVGSIFTADAARLYPAFPTIERLPPRKTQFWQFAGITADEGTIEGTYQVHDDIYLHQLKLDASATPGTADDFSERLYLVHGDQLTTQRIRAVQQEQLQASRAYDRRQWICGIPAWFHIQMNLLQTIIRTHWAPAIPTESTIHCISSDAMRWGRSQNSRENIKYHLMEPIVAQGFTSRVAALFYAALHRRSLLDSVQRGSTGRVEEMEDIVQGLTASQFLEIVEEIRVAAFTRDAWLAPDVDINYRTMCRFLQEVELFLVVRHAVKYGDIGMLRRMVDPLIVVFFGASQHNYGREMLHYRWNLSAANTPVLQRAILSSGLVNWVGRESTFKPIDLALEHLNCHCKLDLRNFKNSTHDIEIVFQRTALCNTWVRNIRNQLQREFGETISGLHTSATAISDMYLLAWTLFVGGYAQATDKDIYATSCMFDSTDILEAGIGVLEERVEQFNQQYTRPSTTGVPLVSSYTVDNDGFEDISAFAEVVGEAYDIVDDATLDLTRIPIVDLS
jgi:hypothetical protein